MITQETREQVARECATRRMVTGTGDHGEGTACLMSAVNLGLTGRLTDKHHPYVSEAVRGLVVGLHDSLPDAVRSGQAWRSLGPLMLGTGDDGHDDERVRMILGWVRGSVLSDDTASAAAYAAATAYAYDYATAYARAAASSVARAAAARAADDDDAYAAAREEFWRRVDAPGLIRSLCEVGR
jgi:hypothetical protein